MSMRFGIGVLLAFGIGFACRASGIAIPAPPALAGAVLVVAMTAGYRLADRYMARRSAPHVRDCGGATGQPQPSERVP
jgi:XapX domain-containing protein